MVGVRKAANSHSSLHCCGCFCSLYGHMIIWSRTDLQIGSWRCYAMKKYEYVSVHIGKLVGAKSEEHRQIIDEYAKKGYRYVGYIPTVISDYGKIKDMDLIFEMDI